MTTQVVFSVQEVKAVTGPFSGNTYDLRTLTSFSVVLDVTDASTPGTASAVIQVKNGSSAWVNLATPTTISANGSLLFSIDRPSYEYARVTYALASGSFTGTVNAVGKQISS